MKKNVLIFTSCFLAIFIYTSVYGAEGPYVSLNLGAAMAYDMDVSEPGLNSFPATVVADPEIGLSASTSLGYDADFFRYELEFLYQKNDFDDYSATSTAGSVSGPLNGDVTSLALMLNGYFDIRSFSVVVPYLTAGIGYANVQVSPITVTVPGYGAFATGASDDDNVFAYQLGVGVGYAVNESITADFKYRYFATDDPEFSNVTTEFSSHNVHVGLRFAF